MPSPLTTPEADWMWHNFVHLSSVTGTQSDDGSQIARIEIDSKAMRRVKANDQLIFVCDANLVSGTPTYDFLLGTRVLVGE
jgi:hypothetical protein